MAGVRFSGPRPLLLTAAVTGGVALAAGVLMSRAHLLLPRLFPEPASFPYLDALTTVMSLVAMWLMVRKRTESWVYWIVVDVIGIGLYYVKAVKFVALLYVLLLAMALRGLVSWVRAGTTE